jgi:hypothetical protein
MEDAIDADMDPDMDEDMDDAMDDAMDPDIEVPPGAGMVDMPCCPSPKSVCSTVWPTARTAAMPGSERSRPANGAATANTARNPAPMDHSGILAQEAIP